MGPVTVNAGGVWSNTGNAPVTFQNGLTFNGATFTAGTGIYPFSTASLQSVERTAAGGAAVTSAVSATATALNIVKTAGPLTPIAGGADTVTYTITVTNPGATAVALTSVVDTLPKPLPNLAGRTIQCVTTAATCLAVTTVMLNGVAVGPRT